jgi:tRNA pseudouridine55 synthase
MGWTSHDVVDAVRRRLGQRAVGHAGTLDPMATGLLILLLGKSTKRSGSFSGLDKSYRGSFRLGLRTDSWDLEGKILEERAVPDLTEEALRRAFQALVGEQMLPTPAFSAVKLSGKKAYALARRGEAMDMPPRPMRIARLELTAFETPEAHFELDCSKGTYVRSIAHVIGERLACGATLSSLVRTRIGDFRLEQAAALDHEDLSRLIRPVS